MAKRRKQTPHARKAGAGPLAGDRPQRRPRTALLATAAIIVLAVAAAALWRGPGAAAPSLRRTPGQNILLVTIDTLRADALTSYGGRARTPNLDALASRGIRYDFAHAHAVLTLPSHASILTGRYPFQHGIRDNSGYRLEANATTLAEMLREAGYATAAFVGAFPLDARFGLHQGFDVYDDDVGENLGSAEFVIAERPASAVVEAANKWIAAQTGRWFAWVHVFDPHAEYTPPAPYDREYADSPYHGEVAYTDQALGALFDAAAQDSARPTFVVVTSDHGEALGDHGELTHGLFAYEATLKVPLIVAQLPAGGERRQWRGASAVSSVAARHIDLLPTVLDVLQQPPAGDLPGRSLLDDPLDGAGAEERTSYFESMSASLNRGWAPLEGVLAGREKYIALPIPELYDLAADPAEQVNLFDRRPDRHRALEARLRSFNAAPPGARAAESADVVARLRALGYVSGAAARKTAYSEEDDPKRLVELDRAVHEGVDLYQRGRPGEAAQVYRRVLERRPDMAVAYRHLALLEWELGDPKTAIATLKSALARGISEAGIPTQLGTYLAEAGSPGEAIPLLEATLRAAPPDVDALNALGIAYARSGEPRRALETFRRILEIDSGNAMAHENTGSVYLQQGDLSSARKALEAAVAANPRSSAAHTGLGVLALRSGDRTAAIASWRRAVELDRRNFDALYNLAAELINDGQRDAARPYADLFVRTAPSAFYAAEIERLGALLRSR